MKKQIFFYIIISIVAVFLSGCKNETISTSLEDKTEKIDESISIVALGDNLLHMPVINSGKQPDGSYDYAHLFEGIQPLIKEADLSVIGQETVFGGKELGYSGYPLFNSPTDMGDTLAKEGFDVVLHASNHILDKWERGIEHTLDFWKKYPQITVLGINESPTDKQTIDIVSVKGARLALLNYTYGTNGLTLSEEKDYLVNYIDEEKIATDITYAEVHADFTIAFMHWGTEYSITADEEQTRLAQMMCEKGVDLIIGSHPHVIEPAEWITSENGNKALVYYSLGNFVSRQLEARNLLGGVAKVTLGFDGERVWISDAAFMPIVTHYDTTYTKFAVYPLKQYTPQLASIHGVAAKDGEVTVKRFRDMVDETFEGYDKTIIDY